MSDQANGGNQGAQLRVLTQYVKDLSFENPNAPQSLGPVDEQPAINLRVDVGVKRVADNDYEVALKIGAEAVLKEKPMFIAEVEYAGLFRLMNIPEADLEAVLVVECPRQIFPFARRILSDITRDGGFPPLMIDPIDFISLYQQRREQMAAQVESAAKPN